MGQGRASTEDGLRYRKKLKTRLAIERAALELVSEHGFDKTTVEDICARAEMSKKTFFNYFSSKAAAVVGGNAAFPDADALAEVLERRRGSESYLDTIVGIMGVAASSDADPELAELRSEVLRAMPQLFFQHRRDLAPIQASISGALAKHFSAHPDDRLLPDRSIEEEAMVAMSAALSLARTGAMLRVCRDACGGIPHAASARQLVMRYLQAADERTSCLVDGGSDAEGGARDVAGAEPGAAETRSDEPARGTGFLHESA